MKKFLIITNPSKDQGLQLTETIARYITSNGCSCQTMIAHKKKDSSFRYTDPSLIPEDTDCIMVLGGDGTMLQAARDVVQLSMPLIGVNLGNMGFLAEVDRKSLYSALDKLMRDSCEMEERMMLSGEVYRGEEKLGEDIALNDITISREGNHLRVVRLINYVNGEYLTNYQADGIVVATPTGSTGYSLSVGGPIVSPNAEMMIMTPIAPHTLTARSIVLPSQDVVTVELGPGRHQDVEKGLVCFDSDTVINMVSGDRVIIRKAALKTRIIRLNRLSFVEVLRQKMD
ncbi:MAG: NAD(+)/NADH kinase [Blautia sp.]|nr:NAD(+)/NADH kinase [Blautia sp.]